jgi:oligopeptide transport system substrate-binding protein
MKSWIRAIVITLLVVVVVVAFHHQRQNRDTRAERAMRDGILLLGNGTEPASLDPQIATGVTESNIIVCLFEGLVIPHQSDDDGVEPGVAERWESNDDASEWTFFLRDNARWSNGDPVTAHDFVWAYQRMLTPALGADYANMMYVIDQAEEFHTGKLDDFGEVGVTALDDHTLKLRLVGPTPHFPYMLQHKVFLPVHPPTILAHGEKTSRVSRWIRPGNMVSNGPFQLKTWRFRDVIEVERNPYYWDADVVGLNEIHFFSIEQATTEERAFRDGLLHYGYTIPLERMKFYQDENKLGKAPEFQIHPYFGTYFYRFNVTRPPFDDLRVRQALSMAIDRQAIIDNIMRGGQQPAWSIAPPMENLYEPPKGTEFNVEKARELLAEAGFPNGEGFPSASILINTSEAHRVVAEAIQAMWQTHLGIRVGITNQDWQVYLATQSNLEYDISRAGWIGDYLDPVSFLDMWTTGNGMNQTGWSNEEFDALIQAATREGDADARLDILRQAETLMMSEAPIAPIYIYTRTLLLDPRVRGWDPKLLDTRPMKHVRFATDEELEQGEAEAPGVDGPTS